MKSITKLGVNEVYYYNINFILFAGSTAPILIIEIYLMYITNYGSTAPILIIEIYLMYITNYGIIEDIYIINQAGWEY